MRYFTNDIVLFFSFEKKHHTHLLLSFSEVYLAPDDDDELYIAIRIQHKTLQQNLNRKLHLEPEIKD